jgi:peptide methionine sulfoxide reductase MsrB
VEKNYMSKILFYLFQWIKSFIDSSSSKFDSHCGWPAFSSSVGTSVRRQIDVDGYREEILCANCDGHLGWFEEILCTIFMLYKF